MNGLIRVRAITCLLLVSGLQWLEVDAARASDEAETVHWAYSSFFGTGWYHIDDNRSVFVLSVAPRQVVRRSAFEDGKRKLGIVVRYPLAVGMHQLDFEDIPGILYPENFGTASFTPGLEVEIPVKDRFYLRPSLRMGAGIEFDTKETAWIWEIGIKGRYSLPTERIDLNILGGLSVAGHNAEDSRSDHISGALLGLEARQPLKRDFRGQAWDLHWHLSYTALDRELKFDNGGGSFDEIDDIFELGFAISPRGRPFKFWRWKPDRLGVGIKFSPEGDFTAVTLITRSWFTK